jgi:nitrate/nitrite transporter NarK
MSNDNGLLTNSQKRTVLLFACLVGFAFSANYTNHAPLKTWLMASFNTPAEPFTKAMFGFLTTAIFATHAIMQIPGGFLADKFGGKRIIVLALIIVSIGNFGIAFSDNYTQLLAWKFFVGLGTGASFVAGARYIYQCIPTEKLLLYQGYYGASILLGSGFVIFVVPQVADHYKGWSPTFILTASLAALVCLIILFAAPNPPDKSHPQTSLLKMLANGQLWLLGFVQMASFGLVIVISSWVTTMLKENFADHNKFLISFIASLALLLGIFTRPFGGKLLAKIGVKQLIITSLLINAAGCFIIAAFKGVFVADIIAVILLGIGCGLPYSGIFNRAAFNFPGRAGAAMGLVNMLGIVFILVAAPLVGRITDHTGNFNFAFVSMGIFALLICITSLKIKKDQA